MKRTGYLGGYTRETKGAGITRWELAIGPGTLEQVAALPQVENPSYLALSQDGRALYAGLEVITTLGEPGGGVASFVFEGDNVACLSIQSTEGTLTCHVGVIPEKHKLYAANYGGGSVSVFDILPDHSLSPCLQVAQRQGKGADPLRQEAPHAHQALPLSPEELLVMDLGLDEGLLYEVLPDGLLGDIKQHLVFPTGSGPRHAVLHPSGQSLFVTCELSNQVFSFRRGEGGWEQLQALSTLPQGYQGESFTAAIRLHADGEHLAISNRGHDSVCLLSVRPTGEMVVQDIAACGGHWPRDVHWLDDYLVCACERDQCLTTLWMDARSGRLMPAGKPAQTECSPACILPAKV